MHLKMKIHTNHLLFVWLVLLHSLKIIRAASVGQTEVVKRKLNANFLASQCWEPTKPAPVLSLIVDVENKPTVVQPTNTGTSSADTIADNDLRAYYYYLSDPDLKIEIKQECEATEISVDRKLKITRHKYLFVDSKGGQVEVVSEESEPHDPTRENLEAENQPKVSKRAKHLLMSLISGGADYTIKQKDDDQ